MEKDLVDFLLSDFRRSPAMFLGTYSLSKFSIFVAGFNVACWEYDTTKRATNRFLHFQDWFNKKYAIGFSSDWVSPFLNLTKGDDKAALDLFFKELELFEKETPRAED